MKKLIVGCLTILMSFLSCTKEDSQELTFLGDSIIQLWDVKRQFPTFVTHNLGRSESGIDYVESLTGKFQGQTVIVETGTNDIGHIVNEELYVDRYIKSVERLHAERIILMSILPRGVNPQANAQMSNPRIRRLNQSIQRKAVEQGWVFVDIFDDLSENGCMSPAYTYDGIHPNADGYAVMKREIMKHL